MGVKKGVATALTYLRRMGDSERGLKEERKHERMSACLHTSVPLFFFLFPNGIESNQGGRKTAENV